MPTLKLRCRCGTVRGTVDDVTPKNVNHGICYCDDCQTFASHLGTEGVVDAWGGTPIVQVGPARMHIDEGKAEVRCLRLSPKGLFRFYTACCKTPIGNAMPPIPFVGIPRVFFEVEEGAHEATFGRPDTIHGRFAKGTPPHPLEPKIGFLTIAKTAKRLAGWALFARKPSPFFGAEKEPIVTPEILPKAEREKLRAALTA